MPQKKQIAAFTLLELLVTLGILAVLVTLCLMTLPSLKQKQQNITCIGNLKTLGQAILTHAADNGGRSVAAVLPPEVEPVYRLWYQQLKVGGYLDKGYEKLLTCPAWPVKGDFNANTSAMFTYGLRRRPEESRKYDPAWSIGGMETPSRYVLLADSHKQLSGYGNQFYYITWKEPSAPEQIHARHNRHANIFFGDGSVRSLDKDEILNLEDGWNAKSILTEE